MSFLWDMMHLLYFIRCNCNLPPGENCNYIVYEFDPLWGISFSTEAYSIFTLLSCFQSTAWFVLTFFIWVCPGTNVRWDPTYPIWDLANFQQDPSWYSTWDSSRQHFSTGDGWRMTGGGWRVAGDGWWVTLLFTWSSWILKNPSVIAKKYFIIYN